MVNEGTFFSRQELQFLETEETLPSVLPIPPLCRQGKPPPSQYWTVFRLEGGVFERSGRSSPRPRVHGHDALKPRKGASHCKTSFATMRLNQILAFSPNTSASGFNTSFFFLFFPSRRYLSICASLSNAPNTCTQIAARPRKEGTELSSRKLNVFDTSWSMTARPDLELEGSEGVSSADLAA